jgi:hypothetical protein
MLTGLLFKESPSDLSGLDRLNITKTETWNVPNAAEFQPKVWTAISFEADDATADVIAEELSRVLKASGWYIDARCGDPVNKVEAQTYAQVIGIPPSQINWGD